MGLRGPRRLDSTWSFLLDTNGGYLSPKNTWFDVSRNPEFHPEVRAVCVEHFFQLCGVARPELSLTQILESNRARIPSGTVPIARDDLGNLFLLGVSGDLRDMVSFWDHETAGFDPPDHPLHNICRLCDSFGSFADSLVAKDAVPPYDG